MNTVFMRRLDYWLGIPLCFLMSVADLFLKMMGLASGKKKGGHEKFLFIKLSEMGAIILAYPLLKRIKEENPAAEMFFLTFEKNKALFGLLDGIIEDKNIFTIREDSLVLFFLDTLSVIKKIRKKKISVVLDLELFSRFTALLSYLSNAHQRIGFSRYTFEGLYRGNLLTHHVQYNPLIHISKSYLSFAQVLKKERKLTPELEEPIDDCQLVLPKFVSDKAQRQKLEKKLKEFGIENEKRLILMNVGEGNLPLREWPLENFIDLAVRVLDDSRNHILLVGTANGSQRADLLCQRLLNKRCISLVGQTTLIELLELFSISTMLISNDSGLAHLASLSSIKKFIIFGPESPQVFSPLGDNIQIIYAKLPCSPCLSALNHRSTACRDNKCLKQIKPEDVFRLLT